MSAYHKGVVYISQNFLYFKQDPSSHDPRDEFVFVVNLANVLNLQRIDSRLIGLHMAGDYRVSFFLFFSFFA